MALTHKSMSEQKAKKMHVKEDDERFKTYSKAQAVEANRKLREDRMKVERYEANLKAEREAAKGTVSQEDQKQPAQSTASKPEALSPDELAEVEALEKKRDSLKGPGSKAKKDAIQEQIDEIKG